MKMDDLNELMDRVLPLLPLFMFSHWVHFSQELVTWRRKMAVMELEKVLHREPTPDELSFYGSELELRNLKQRAQDKQDSYRKIYDLVWGGELSNGDSSPPSTY